MKWATVLFLPVSGALIGWVTNWIAVRMLFRPRLPWRFPGTSLMIQGLVPRRQEELARTIGKTVERDLLAWEDLLGKVKTEEVRLHVQGALVQGVAAYLERRLPLWVPGRAREVFRSLLEEAVEREFPLIWRELSAGLLEHARRHIDIEGLVAERIRNLDLQALEMLIYQVASRELKHIEVLGAVLGFVIGLLQVLLMFLLE